MLNTRYSYFISFCLGVFALLALPPISLIILLIPSFTGLLLLTLSRKTEQQAFFIGWFFGFGHFLTGLYWIAYSLTVEIDKFGWMIPFAVMLIPAILAIFTGAITYLIYRIKLRASLKILLFAILWVIVELMRDVIFQFPWNFIGYSTLYLENIAQYGRYITIYGLSFIVIITATIPFLWWKFYYSYKCNDEDNSGLLHSNISIFEICLSGLAYVVIFIISLVSHTNIESKKQVHNGDNIIRIVQPNIDQRDKHNPDIRYKLLDKYLQLSTLPSDKNISLIIWPEDAIPFSIQNNKGAMEYISSRLKAPLFFGGTRIERYGSGRDEYRAYNSAFLMNKNAVITDYYDKRILVPFGEFVPFHNIIPFVEKVTQGMINFSAGHEIKTIKTDNAPPFSPTICYESAFTKRIANQDTKLLLNITNDGWFGNSLGPYQHLNMARMRAIEEQKPMLRAANTGISAYIDKYGRIQQSLALNKDGIIDVDVGGL